MRIRRGHLFIPTEQAPVQKDRSLKRLHNCCVRIDGVGLAERDVEGDAFRQSTRTRAGGHGQGAMGVGP